MSYLTLYRKYRPKKFNDVVGQKHVVKTLQNALKNNKVAHAYLFCGSRGVGKTTIARLLAKAVNCQNLKKNKNNAESCDKCISCREINENKAIDIIEIDAASNRGINEIRELKEKIKFTPSHFQYKVFIIDEVHMLTIEAFNALLKTLEEPPSHAIFILATTEVHKIPATILSRCQRFDFRRLSQQEIIGQLADIAAKEKVKIDNKSLNLLASNAGGSSRDALSLLNQVLSLEDKEITFTETKSILGIVDLSQVSEFVDYLISRDTKKTIGLINEISDSGYDLKQFFKNLMEYFRKLLLIKVDKNLFQDKEVDLTAEQLNKLKEQSEKITSKELVTYISKFIKAKKEIDDNIISQLPLEVAVIEVMAGIEARDSQLNLVNTTKRGDKDNNLLKKETKNIKNKEDNTTRNNNKKTNSSIKKLDSKIFSNVQKDWSSLIQAVSEKNISLGSFLKVCDPIDIQDEKIVLVCKYNFHKEKLRDWKNKQIIENEVEKLFKAKITFDLILYNDLSKSLKSKADKRTTDNKENKKIIPDLAKQALDFFGGSTA